MLKGFTEVSESCYGFCYDLFQNENQGRDPQEFLNTESSAVLSQCPDIGSPG